MRRKLTWSFSLIILAGVSLALSGCAQVETKSVTAHEPVLIARFSAAPIKGVAPLVVQFTDTSEGKIVAWEWDFENNGTVDSTNQSPSHRYEKPGIYTVRLKVRSAIMSKEVVLEDCITVFLDYLVRTWGGDKSEIVLGIAVDTKGDIYAVGETGSFGTGDRDTLILKYDTNGTIQWAKTWGMDKWDFARSVCIDSSGDIYVVGFTEGSGAGKRDSLLLKYSSSGSLLWARTWGGDEDDELTAAVPAPDGGIYAVGATFSFGVGDREAFLVKCSSAGEIEWAKTWGDKGNDGANAIAIDSSGNAYVGGYTFSFSNGLADAFLLKYDSSGALQWARTCGGKGWDGLSGVAVDSSGNIYGGGQSSSCGTENYDGLILKYDASGSLLWAKTWGTDYDDSINAVAIDSSDRVYAAGCARRLRSGRLGDVLLLNYSDSGTLKQARTWGSGNRNHKGYGLAIDSRDNVYIGGASSGQIGDWKEASGREMTLPWKEDSPIGAQEIVKGKTGAPAGVVTSPEGSHSGQRQNTIIIKNW